MTSPARGELLAAARRFYESEKTAPAPFQPGRTYLPAAGKSVGLEELELLIEAAADLWLTAGRFAERFEAEFAAWLGRRFALLCNSGSSANLLALQALTSPLLGDRALKPGDEVLTVAAGFPTTVNPILQAGLVPVYVDVSPETLNADPDLLEAAWGPKVKAICLAHALGLPFDLDRAQALARDRDLWLIEDNCDALGSLWQGRKTGTFGHLATFSFYPAHHMTTGEGGAVATDDPLLKRIVESLRDWGRDCWCPPGRDDTCGRRFDGQFGELPPGYDHKYVYRHLGYNLKATDFAAALGLAQLPKLDGFVEKRRRNYERLVRGLAPVADRLKPAPAPPGSEPAWFGLPLTVTPAAGFTRLELMKHLEERAIGSRLLFGGNLPRQPAYAGTPRRLPGPLTHTDYLMERLLWLGLWPGLHDDALDYMIKTVLDFCRKGKNA